VALLVRFAVDTSTARPALLAHQRDCPAPASPWQHRRLGCAARAGHIPGRGGSSISSGISPAGGELCVLGAGAFPALPHSRTRPGMANARQNSSASARKKDWSRHDDKGGLAG
jgi:hypothetical protein